MDSPVITPLQRYRHYVAAGRFQADAAQQAAAEALDLCRQQLLASGTARGVYLWGPVGRGKTWLLDAFHQSLSLPVQRQHFHHFVRDMHQRLFRLIGHADPLRLVAEELRSEIRVLCFDELFISDIGDAMLLGKLFERMFDCGITVVATSNQPPSHLYADGYNREQLLPAIRAIEQHMQVVALDGGCDHRLQPGAPCQRYWVKDESTVETPLEDVFNRLSAGLPVHRETLQLGGRPLPVRAYSDAALWCRFADLCEAPFASSDFITLCDRFPNLLLSDVPGLGGEQREGRIARGTEDAASLVAAGDRELPMLSPKDDGVRRFIALVDECYDRQVPVYLEAAVALDDLYSNGYLSFAFRRTLSRLREMQLERFGQG